METVLPRLIVFECETISFVKPYEELMEEIAQGLLFIGKFVGSGYASQIDLS